MKRYSNLLKAIGLVLIATTIYSCAGGGPTVPTRKKMPEFTSYDGFEGTMPFAGRTHEQRSGFAFATTNVDMTVNGSTQGFVSVVLPDPATDSAAVSLINTVKPFAMPLLASWALQQRNGVLIDLSSHTGSETHRSDYVLQKQGEFSIPVIVMWDGASAWRVASLKNLVSDMPSVKFNCTSGNDPSSRLGSR